MDDVFEGFERWYDFKNFKTVLRCKKCGAMDEIRDCELRTALRISFAHECRVLPAPSRKNRGEIADGKVQDIV